MVQSQRENPQFAHKWCSREHSLSFSCQDSRFRVKTTPDEAKRSSFSEQAANELARLARHQYLDMKYPTLSVPQPNNVASAQSTVTSSTFRNQTHSLHCRHNRRGAGDPQTLRIVAFAFGFDNPQVSDRVLILQLHDSNKGLDEKRRNNKLGKLLSKPVKSLDGNDEFPLLGMNALRKLHISTMVLASQSPVFKTMLTNGMKESNSKEVVLEVKDEAEAELHVSMVRFLYTAELPVDAKSDELIELLLLADKFETQQLSLACQQALGKIMDAELAVQLLATVGKLHTSDAHKSLMVIAGAVVAETFKVVCD